MDKPFVINLFGAPGSGKSVAASYIFSQLKMKGVECELIQEFAKDLTWEERKSALNCQEYVTGVQSFRMARCADKVDVLITDSPLLLGIFYKDKDILGAEFDELVLKLYNKYINYNYFIMRAHPYNQNGRNQTQAESDLIGDAIQDFLNNRGIIFTCGISDVKFYDYIVNKTVNDLIKHKE